MKEPKRTGEVQDERKETREDERSNGGRETEGFRIELEEHHVVKKALLPSSSSPSSFSQSIFVEGVFWFSGSCSLLLGSCRYPFRVVFGVMAFLHFYEMCFSTVSVFLREMQRPLFDKSERLVYTTSGLALFAEAAETASSGFPSLSAANTHNSGFVPFDLFLSRRKLPSTEQRSPQLVSFFSFLGGLPRSEIVSQDETSELPISAVELSQIENGKKRNNNEEGDAQEGKKTRKRRGVDSVSQVPGIPAPARRLQPGTNVDDKDKAVKYQIRLWLCVALVLALTLVIAMTLRITSVRDRLLYTKMQPASERVR